MSLFARSPPHRTTSGGPDVWQFARSTNTVSCGPKASFCSRTGVTTQNTAVRPAESDGEEKPSSASIERGV